MLNPAVISELAPAEQTVAEGLDGLLRYCRQNEWAGWDPYDALNARAQVMQPLLRHKLPRFLLTQLLKRSPVNLRALLKIPPTQNPKAIALFLSGLLKLSGSGLLDDQASSDPERMVERLAALRSPGTRYSCWGYSFPWQGRAVLVPAGAPNLVCTVFAAGALLDCYEQRGTAVCFEMAASAAEYILNELYWNDGKEAGFSYPLPGLRSRVHNANLLAAALLCRMYRITNDRRFLAPAMAAARYSTSRQKADGGWSYGEARSQQWIDNFHTGFNLCALRQIGRQLNSDEFERHIRLGFNFYKRHFLREDGAARYFYNQTYPVDIHCVAQTILTLLEFADLDEENVSLAQLVADWAIHRMWDDRGFFYYRVYALGTVRTSYMRWSQAWMCLALAALVCNALRQRTSPAEARMFSAVSA